MALPDPGAVEFGAVNSANADQTEKLSAYETAYNSYTQAAIALQEAQNAFDAATQAAQAALDEYSISLAAYNSEAENVGRAKTSFAMKSGTHLKMAPSMWGRLGA